MPRPEDPLSAALEDLATPADPAGAYERIVEKKIRRQIYRKVQVVGLVVAVLFGTVGGTFLLAKTFRGSRTQQRTLAPSSENGKIAFVTYPALGPTDRQGLFLMNPDGTEVVGVTSPDRRRSVALSHDGANLAYSEGLDDGSGELVVSKSDGTDKRHLAHLSDILSPPAWSPDGTRIAYAPGPEFDIRVIHANGGTPARLTHPPADCGDGFPMWAPDGSRIAFLRSCGPNPADIYMVQADGSGLVNLTNGSVQAVFGGSWSPDGHRIAFVVQVKPGGSAYVANRFQIATIEIDGSGYRQLTTDGDNRSPVWSPDSRFIAFTSNRDGRSHVYTMRSDGTYQSNLTPASDSAAEVVTWLPASGGSIEPSESPSPSESTSPTPEPSATASSLPPILECATSLVIGDFDGDGLMDTAGVCQPGPGYSLQVAWGSGASGSVDLTDCQEECRAVAAADLDGDGSDEFVLAVNQGASTEFLEVFELPVSEVFARSAVTVAEPGAPGFPSGEPAVFPVDGSVTHLDFLTCDTAEDGTHQVIATGAVLNQEQTDYAVHETVLTLHPDLDPPYGQFVVVSTVDSTFAFDPTGQSQPQPRGTSCWEVRVGPSPTPAPTP